MATRHLSRNLAQRLNSTSTGPAPSVGTAVANWIPAADDGAWGVGFPFEAAHHKSAVCVAAGIRQRSPVAHRAIDLTRIGNWQRPVGDASKIGPESIARL